MPRSRDRFRALHLALVIGAVLLVGQSIAAAGAAVALPSKLTQFPEEPVRGDQAGQMDNPASIAADPTAGYVYVAEEGRVSKFTAWGQYLLSWGWGVADGSAEPQVCGTPSEPHCQAGVPGSGAGQITFPRGISVDGSGNVYVREEHSFRVQKFSPTGEFILMFGKDVNKTTAANVCTATSGNECGVGMAGTGPGEFGPLQFGNVISPLAVGPNQTVYVGDPGRVEKFDTSGAFLGEILLPPAPIFVPGTPAPSAIAVDQESGVLDLFLQQFESEAKPTVFQLDPTTGSVLKELVVAVPEGAVFPCFIRGIAASSSGSLFVTIDRTGVGAPEEEPRVVEFDAAGKEVITFAERFAAPPTAIEPGADVSLSRLGANPLGDLYVVEIGEPLSGVSVYGPPPLAYGPPPPNPPKITDQYATAVGPERASLGAKINPRFFDDATYYLQYGTAPCFEGGCTDVPVPPGVPLTTAIVDVPLAAPPIELSSLAPSTTYHYRFVAESGGGGPIFGLAGKSGAAAETTFTTLPAAAAQPPCPANAAFRSGAAALLPDCRAYEMVSPIDKNGADIEVVFNSIGSPAELNQPAANGEALSYSAYRAFGTVESAPYTSQYIATRTPGGWSSRGISPPREGPSLYTTRQLDNQYLGFSADLCQGWLLQDTNAPLGEGWTEGSPNIYRRQICVGGTYNAIAPLRHPAVTPIFNFTPELQGFSADGTVALVQANGKLTNNGLEARQVYESVEGGPLRLVCILPGNTPVKTGCSAGSGGTTTRPNRTANLDHAISADGNIVYWTESEEGPGRLYVRVNRNTTTAVDESVQSHFWGAAADGSTAIYSAGAELRRFSLASKSSTAIAGGFRGVLAISEDTSRVYFASTEAIAGAGSNATGAEAVAARPNLYLYEAGEPARVRFIGTLSLTDVSETNNFPSDTASWPIRHLARASGDGGALAFVSTASLTGYNNNDLETGTPASEVFIYKAGSDRLTCVSCMPSGVRPRARLLSPGYLAAARLPGAESQLYSPRVLTEAGTRLFFESFDPLAPTDVDSEQDVYEWEEVGAGNCTAASPGYNAALTGCVNLISSGQSPRTSELLDASADGRDVFFKTGESLVSQDPGLVDIYDAREGGGFPSPAAPDEPCQGEACQSHAPPPAQRTPSSQAVDGSGNVKPTKCPAGKQKAKRHGKSVCVKQKQAQKRHHKSKKSHGKKHKHQNRRHSR